MWVKYLAEINFFWEEKNDKKRLNLPNQLPHFEWTDLTRHKSEGQRSIQKDSLEQTRLVLELEVKK